MHIRAATADLAASPPAPHAGVRRAHAADGTVRRNARTAGAFSKRRCASASSDVIGLPAIGRYTTPGSDTQPASASGITATQPFTDTHASTASRARTGGDQRREAAARDVERAALLFGTAKRASARSAARMDDIDA